MPGDVFLVSEGDKIPADARLIDENRLMVNNAPLTGESESKARSHNPFAGDSLESPNIVFAGTLVVSGTGKAVAFATGMSTEFGKIAHLTSAVEPRIKSSPERDTEGNQDYRSYCTDNRNIFLHCRNIYGKNILA